MFAQVFYPLAMPILVICSPLNSSVQIRRRQRRILRHAAQPSIAACILSTGNVTCTQISHITLGCGNCDSVSSLFVLGLHITWQNPFLQEVAVALLSCYCNRWVTKRFNCGITGHTAALPSQTVLQTQNSWHREGLCLPWIAPVTCQKGGGQIVSPSA